MAVAADPACGGRRYEKMVLIFPVVANNGVGLGAWQQTGWTALVVELIRTRHRR
jgi:hypothetical protein